jgi:hypothetical protein
MYGPGDGGGSDVLLPVRRVDPPGGSTDWMPQCPTGSRDRRGTRMPGAVTAITVPVSAARQRRFSHLGQREFPSRRDDMNPAISCEGNIVRRIARILSAAAAIALTTGALLASPAAAATSVTPAAAKTTPTVIGGMSDDQVTSDDEQSVTLFVTVSGPSGAPAPTGGVILLAGGSFICVITLVNGSGTCPLPSGFLPIGSNQISASYSGDAHYNIATGTFPPLIVTGSQAATTNLTLSPATVAFGSQNTETFTVSVTGSGGTPTGQVVIQFLDTSEKPENLCAIALVNGTGSCSPLPARRTLNPGSWHFRAIYDADNTFAPSISATVTLTITP